VQQLEAVEDGIAAANDALEATNVEATRLEIHAEVCGPHTLLPSAEDAEELEEDNDDEEDKEMVVARPAQWPRAAAVEWRQWRTRLAPPPLRLPLSHTPGHMH
jgi:hypothetical protein